MCQIFPLVRECWEGMSSILYNDQQLLAKKKPMNNFKDPTQSYFRPKFWLKFIRHRQQDIHVENSLK